MKAILKKWWLGTLLGLVACTAGDHAGDVPATHFTAWIKGSGKYFNTYLVVRLNGCSSCSQTIIKVIKDRYLDLMPKEAIVLVVDGQSELHPIKDKLHLPNLLVYSHQEHRQPILADGIRLYRYSKGKGFSFQELTAQDFATLTSRMLNQDLLSFKDPTMPSGGSILDVIRGIAIPGQEALVMPSDSGWVEVSPSI